MALYKRFKYWLTSLLVEGGLTSYLCFGFIKKKVLYGYYEKLRAYQNFNFYTLGLQTNVPSNHTFSQSYIQSLLNKESY